MGGVRTAMLRYMSNLFVGTSHSSLYIKYRPTAPEALINEIVSFVKQEIPGDLEKAIDVGCGTGQSTRALHSHFKNITGFDVSETQLKEAREQANGMQNLTYGLSKAESLPVANASVQLVTVSQAVHWFDLPAFFKEVHRILVPKGVLATYSYLIPMAIPDDLEKTEAVQDIVTKFYGTDLKSFWDKRRYMIDDKYVAIQYPKELFSDVTRIETIVDRKRMLFSDYIGYLQTWSAYQQLKLKDSDRAEKLLNGVVESLIETIGGKSQSPNDIHLTIEIQFILLMGRKKG